MRRRAVKMATLSVVIAVLLVGVPMAIFGSTLLWNEGQSKLDDRVVAVSSVIERRIDRGDDVTADLLESWAGSSPPTRFIVHLPDRSVVEAGPVPNGGKLSSAQSTVSGAVVIGEVDATHVWVDIARFVALVAAAALIALIAGVLLATRTARRLTAPLIYLAASAEQIGAGHVRPQLNETGIEEIDLVSEELVRTADRMAGRLAAERQFAADASHQLRTPLTALSMRLDEIEMLTEEEDVLEEVHACQAQVERLTGVVEELLKTSRSDNGGTTEAVHIRRVFAQQRDEWERVFTKAKREFVVEEPEDLTVLSTPGSLAQIIATLIENSLKYGDGTTTLAARQTANRKGVVITVGDEGPGVADDIAEHIFDKHVSTGGSTGLGLALAKDLARADGGRLELTQKRPPVFSLTLNSVPISLDPDKVLPQGALISVGNRRRRR